MKNLVPVFEKERKQFHNNLLSHVLSIDSKGIPSIADCDNSASKRIATCILQKIGKCVVGNKKSPQASGVKFEVACADYLKNTFLKLSNLRPGDWTIGRTTEIAECDQYEHLSSIVDFCAANPGLKATLGIDYIIRPDIIISRVPVDDAVINKNSLLVDSNIARMTPIRRSNTASATLHASVSCKLTLRSDRAQNARSEALNLIKNRKGRVPHIVIVTAEPLPSRLASLALGTGEIDCVYHFALPELVSAVSDESEDSKEMLNIMITGKRLRDIADLPLDLAL